MIVPTEKIAGFGLKPQLAVTAWWGARAIVEDHGRGFSLLADRQQIVGSPADQIKLAAWLDLIGLSWLRKEIELHPVIRADDTLHTLEAQGYRLEASGQRSFGYLYIGAWRPA